MGPLSIPTNSTPEGWLGYDGSWSTFSIGIGTPKQFVMLFPSTASYLTYVVNPQGCNNSTDPSFCESSRGGFYNNYTSSTWQSEGVGDMEIEVPTTAANESTLYGYENIVMGASTSSGPDLENQIIGSMSSTDFFLGLIGLRPIAGTQFNEDVESIVSAPTLLQNLKTAGLISSLSWGYTAGSFGEYQQSSGRPISSGQGSLTLGGYDSAYFMPNNLTFAIHPENSTTFQDLVIGLSQIAVLLDNSSTLHEFGASSLSSVYLDSTTPFLWLPQDMCDAMAQLLGFTYNQELDLYLANETVHDTMYTKNITMKLMISTSPINEETAPTVPIYLPYLTSLDMHITNDYPGVPPKTGWQYYFPIRRARSSKYILGRAFFQSAYVIADYERLKFYVHQAIYPQNGTTNLQTINSISNDTNATSTSLTAASTTLASTAAASVAALSIPGIIGIVVGVVVLLVVILLTGFFIWRKRKRSLKVVLHTRSTTSAEPDNRMGSQRGNAELQAEDAAPPELVADAKQRVEFPAGEVAKEMKADVPPTYEMGA